MKKKCLLILAILAVLPFTFASGAFGQDEPQDQQAVQASAQQAQPSETSQDQQNAAAQDDQHNPPDRVARVNELEGNVSLQPSGETDWTTAGQNGTMTSGDRIYTDTDSRAELQVGPLSVHLSQLTDLTVVNLNDQLAQFGMASGSVQISIFNLPEGTTVELDTPNGALTLQAPGTYRADVDTTAGSTLVSVYKGTLLVTGGGVSQTINSGRAATLTGTDQLQIADASLAADDDFEKWVQGDDKRAISARSEGNVSPDIPGASDLDEYGQWGDSPDGSIWYPSGVAAGWVPYSVGRWAWVDPWGWTWVDAAPWGFAPFHYGRWAYFRGRWGWVPGPVAVVPVYCPALVAFVGGPGFAVGFGTGGFGLAAWFPLGPGEPFIPWYHYGPRYFRAVNVTNIRNVTHINFNNVQNVHYAYKTTAVTAVNGEIFRSGQPVQRGFVKVTPAQMERAQIIEHPTLIPARTAVISHPVAAPKNVRPSTFTVADRKPAPAAMPHPNQAPTGNEPRPAAPVAHAAPPAQNSRAPFVTSHPPPPPRPEFSTRQQAMSSHPGRPLEPQQMDNLRNGKPAGPQVDREVHPHFTPSRPAPPPPPSHSAPPPSHSSPPPRKQ